jgi:hypothetical protein
VSAAAASPARRISTRDASRHIAGAANYLLFAGISLVFWNGNHYLQEQFPVWIN